MPNDMKLLGLEVFILKHPIIQGVLLIGAIHHSVDADLCSSTEDRSEQLYLHYLMKKGKDKIPT